MKKLLFIVLTSPLNLMALAGPQPLYFSNLTFNPNGCPTLTDPNTTTNILAIAAGGQPPYTYTLLVNGTPFGSPQTSPTATFVNAPAQEDVNLVVTDSLQNSATSILLAPASQTLQVIMNITSLPLGNAPGCISLQVVGPGGKLNGTVDVGISSVGIAPVKPLTTPPFIQQFAAFTTSGESTLTALIEVQNDCDEGDTSVFTITFPFPQGFSNALKAYIFNKYCSCTLSTNTVLVS